MSTSLDPYMENTRDGLASTEEVISMLADLERKLSSAQQEENELKRRFSAELDTLARRRQLIEAMMEGIKTLYTSQLSSFEHGYESATASFKATRGFHFTLDDALMNERSTATHGSLFLNESNEFRNSVEKVANHRRRRGLLRDLVIEVIEKRDTFLSMDEVTYYINLENPHELIERKHVSTGLKDYRRSKKVVAYPAYDANGNRSFLNGLPEFFYDYRDAANPSVKPHYAEKLMQRAHDLQLSLVKPANFKAQDDEEDYFSDDVTPYRNTDPGTI